MKKLTKYGSYYMPKHSLCGMSRWFKLWKTCVSTAGIIWQSFPPSNGQHLASPKLCKNTTIFHHLVNNLPHRFSTLHLNNSTTIKRRIFHTFHSLWKSGMMRNVLIHNGGAKAPISGTPFSVWQVNQTMKGGHYGNLHRFYRYRRRGIVASPLHPLSAKWAESLLKAVKCFSV